MISKTVFTRNLMIVYFNDALHCNKKTSSHKTVLLFKNHYSF